MTQAADIPAAPARQSNDGDGYIHSNETFKHAHAYLLPAIKRLLAGLKWKPESSKRVFDLGCGNGAVGAWMTELGYDPIGVDPSVDGIQKARKNFPHVRLEVGSAYDNLQEQYGTFPLVTSLEVVEHVYFPRKFAAGAYSLVEPGGTAIISTPYHGYLKNLLLAITGKMDNHFTALWDHGHIKFWSRKTLARLLLDAGFKSVTFQRVGRMPIFAKSMIAIAKK